MAISLFMIYAQSQKEVLTNWQQVKLSDVLKIGSGKDYKHLGVGSIPVFGTGGYMLSVDKPLYSGETVFIGRKGTIDKPFYYRGDFWTVDTLFYTYNYINTTAKFMNYIFQIINWKKYNEASGVPSLSKATIERIKIKLPEPSEQNRIVAVLETWDKAIEKLTKKIEIKKNIKKGLMQDLLTGKKRLKGFEDKNRVVKLGEVAIFKKGKGLPKSVLNCNGKYEAIHYGELFTKYNECIERVISKTDSIHGMLLSKKNDILMPTSDVTPRGLSTASYIDKDGVILGGDILVIRPASTALNGLFFCYIVNLNKQEIIKLVSGSTVFHLYGSEMAKFQFKLPSLNEQEMIVKILVAADKELQKLSNKLQNIKDQKKYLLNNLITGAIRTPEKMKIKTS